MLRKAIVPSIVVGGLLLATSFLALGQADSTETPGEAEMTTGYADVNGLHMYYEIHGTGEPLVVLHGAYMNIPVMGEIIPRLAESRQVIAVELQGHGRTADVDRPITYEQLADDVTALMAEIGVERADIFGYSMGGGTALQIAMRHPEVVNKLVVASANYNNGGLQPGLVDMISTMTPEMFEGSPVVDTYRSLAPNPDDFPALVEKLIQLDLTFQGWSPEAIQAIAAPTMVIAADNDSMTLEHTISLYQLRGGGLNGDLTGLPEARLAIIPGTTHISLMFRADLLTPLLTEFLDAPPAQ
jgi:pimeloyl-ACP methyl ester carboxylesterase